jgi:hypothetical protein
MIRLTPEHRAALYESAGCKSAGRTDCQVHVPIVRSVIRISLLQPGEAEAAGDPGHFRLGERFALFDGLLHRA